MTDEVYVVKEGSGAVPDVEVASVSTDVEEDDVVELVELAIRFLLLLLFLCPRRHPHSFSHY